MKKLEDIFIDRDFERLLFHEEMKNHTSFKIGGPADLLIDVRSEEEIIRALRLSREMDLDYFIMGNGSNLLVKDSGLRRVVIKICSGFEDIDIEGDLVYAQAGALLSTIANKALKSSLEGFEFASGIPGTVGGAITMNAGAYGGEMKDIVERVKVLDRNNDIAYIDGKDMDFRYRGSKIVDQGLVVLGVEFRLRKADPKEIKAKMDELKEKRTSKQPLEMASAGSTFKRPEGYFAGKLIDDAGLRGLIHGQAQVSEKHCGFLVNRGQASYKEVMELIETVQKVVYDKYKVRLETEVKIIGD